MQARQNLKSDRGLLEFPYLLFLKSASFIASG